MPTAADLSILDTSTRDSTGKSTVVQHPVYDPFTQTTAEFEQQMRTFFDAPIDPPVHPFLFRTIRVAQSFENLVYDIEKLSRLRLNVCRSGHRHEVWPYKGKLVIAKCQTKCQYCATELKTAAGLRKVSLIFKPSISRLTLRSMLLFNTERRMVSISR
jgi:hypothetical protein